MSNENGHGVPGSQRDEMQIAREVEFNKQMLRSISAAKKDPPDIAEALGALWIVNRTFQQQQFEQEGLLSHVATQTEVGISIGRGNDGKLDALLVAMKANARASQPLLNTDASGAHRAQAADVTALQQQIELVAVELKSDVAAVGRHVSTECSKLQGTIDEVKLEIGEAPRPGDEDEKKRKGTGLQRKVALLFNVRSMALFVVAAFVSGGALSIIIIKLFELYLIPLLMKGHL